MAEMIGLRSLGLPTKQEALLFDKFFVPHYGVNPDPGEIIRTDQELLALEDYLGNHNIIEPFPKQIPGIGYRGYSLALATAYFEQIKHEPGISEEMNLFSIVAAGLCTELSPEAYPDVTVLPSEADDSAEELVTIMNAFSQTRNHSTGEVNKPGNQGIYQAVLSHVPMPGDNVPWEQVVEFRADKEVRRRFAALRHWVRKVAEGQAVQDAAEELDYLIHQYDEYMRVHRMECRWDIVRIVSSTPAKLFPWNWKDLLTIPADIAKCRINLLKAELKAPGRELSYLTTAREEFT